MSGGKRIDDHRFWGGEKPRGTVFPERSKMKEVKEAAGDDEDMDYQDTEEAIYRTQEEGDRKARSENMKPGYRH